MKIFVGFVLFLLVFTACEKDDTSPENLDENTIVFNGESYNVSTGYILNQSEDTTENSWKIAIRGQYEPEESSQTDTTTGVVAIGNSNFTIIFELISLNSSSPEGSFHLGDLNGDGITNELDATGDGYCTSATIDMEETTYFYEGEFTLKAINTGTNNFNIEFSLTDGVDQTISGNVDLIYNDN